MKIYFTRMIVLSATALFLFANCRGSGGDAKTHTVETSDTKQITYINAKTGGTVSLGRDVTLAIPPYGLDKSQEISVKKIASPSDDGDVFPVAAAYEFGQHGLQFSLPATLTMCYSENELIANGLNKNSVQVYYYDGNEFQSQGGSIDNGCVSTQIQHFSVYVAAANLWYLANQRPRISSPNTYPATPMLGVPLTIRSVITDFNEGTNFGQIAATEITYSVNGGTPITAPMQMDTSFTTGSARYSYTIPAAQVGASIQYTIRAWDNFNLSHEVMRNLTITAVPAEMTITPTDFDIVAGFHRNLTVRVRASTDAVFRPVDPESINILNGIGNATLSGPGAVDFEATTSGDPLDPVSNQRDGGVEVTYGPLTQSNTIHVWPGQLEEVQILDDAGMVLSSGTTIGNVEIGINEAYDFDARGLDAYGNYSLIRPWWSTIGPIGSFSTPTNNLFQAGSTLGASGQVVINVAGITTYVNVNLVIPPAPILPLYAAYPNWNDYLLNNGSDYLTADGTSCTTGPGNGFYTGCLHSGEIRVFELVGLTSCLDSTGTKDITATDNLGVFEWICDDSVSPVRMVSAGLRPTSGLSDFIDFGSLSWRQNTVNVFDDGTQIATSIPGVWYGNPIVEITTAGTYNSAGTVYLINSNSIGQIDIDAHQVSVLVNPVNRHAGGLDYIYTSLLRYGWVEGNYSATTGFAVRPARFYSVTNNVTTEGSIIAPPFLARMRNITIANLAATAAFSAAGGTIIENLTLANSGNTNGVGLNIDGGLNSSNGSLVGLTIANNGAGCASFGAGIYSHGSPEDVSIFNVTVANPSCPAARVFTSTGFYLQNFVTPNSSTGISMQDSSGFTFQNLALTNTSSSIGMLNSSDNQFFGELKIGSPFNTCAITGGTNTGVDTTTCAPNNGSAFNFTTGISEANSFVGKVSSDSVNANGATGTALFSTITDFSRFENIYRSWGRDGSAFPNTDHRGACVSGQTCRIWDWSMSLADTGVIRAALPKHLSGNPGDALTHDFTSAGSVTFLRNAVEKIGDFVGNDNGFCESGETCVYTPNIGSYQGHGNLVSAGTFVDGTALNGITLLEYDNNGY